MLQPSCSRGTRICISHKNTVLFFLVKIVITVLYVQLQTIYLLIADFKEGSMYKFRVQIGVCLFALLLLQKSKITQYKPSDQF